MSDEGKPMAARSGLRRPADPALVRYGPDGLVPGVVQDAEDGEVLMLGYLDAEALAATRATGRVHFHSRSRGTLWRKGETSGNELRVRAIARDCDGDALLLTVTRTGPTCHTGARSCFEEPTSDPIDEASGRVRPPVQGLAWLETLWATIDDRAQRRPAGSYTARLIEGGVDATARKVLEEAAEVVLAAKDDAADPDSGPARERLSAEIADLVFHLLVLARERGLSPRAIVDELRARHGST